MNYRLANAAFQTQAIPNPSLGKPFLNRKNKSSNTSLVASCRPLTTLRLVMHTSKKHSRLTRLTALVGDNPTLYPLYSMKVATIIRNERTINRSEEHTSELQSPCNLVCRLLLEKKKKKKTQKNKNSNFRKNQFNKHETYEMNTCL